MSITFKRHYRLLLALVLVVVGLITLLPDTRIVAYTVAGNEEPPEYVINYDNDALVTAYNQEHTLVDQAAYDAAVQSVLDLMAQRYTFLQTTGLLSQ
jgi:hypothetical protein